MKDLFLGTIAVSITALMLQIILLSGIAEAEELYTKSAEMICADTKVRVVTECYDDSVSLPYCTKQYIEFTPKDVSKTFYRTTIGKSGDYFLATSWACVEGKSQSYLLINYNTGGNCEDCEWTELLDLRGKKMANNRGKTAGKANKYFEKIYKQIGLPHSWPRSSFVRIPLARKN